MKKGVQLWINSGLRPIPASKTEAELQITGNMESQVIHVSDIIVCQSDASQQ